jgi:hypothetical protein
MTMTFIRSFLLGMMLVWTPSLLLLAWYLLKEEQSDRALLIERTDDRSAQGPSVEHQDKDPAIAKPMPISRSISINAA